MSATKKSGARKSRDRDDADDIENIYQKKTQLEHILLRPDTYIGSIEMFQQYLWVYDQEQNRIDYKQVSYVPGLYKIFGKNKGGHLNLFYMLLET